MQLFDVPQRRAPLPQHTIDDALCVKERQRVIDERRRPKAPNERRGGKGAFPSRRIDHVLEERHHGGVGSIPRIRERRPPRDRPKPEREVVSQWGRLGCQLPEVRRIAEERRPDLLRTLEADLTQARRQCGALPQRGDRGRRQRTRGVTSADEHQVGRRAVPERAVIEHLAERAHDRIHVGARIRPRDRQPVCRHAAVGEPVVDQLEVLAGINVDSTRGPRRWRLPRDQIEALRRRLQEEPAILEMKADARIVKRTFPGRIDHITRGDDIARDLDHVERLERRDVGDRTHGDADSVANDEGAPHRSLMQQHRPVREVPHVAQRGRGGAGH